jgi:enediyne biosynthesis protein E4
MRRWWAVAALCLAGSALWVSSGNAGPEPRRPHFTDIASKSNFAYRTDNNFTGRKYFPQTMCGGVAAFDFDDDGRMDLFFTNGAKLPEMEKSDARFYNCLLRNRGDGTFEDVTAHAGLLGKDLGFSFGVAVGDYDNDGHEDLFVCNAGRNTLYHNNGDGTFTDVTERSGIGTKPKDVLSVAAAWFDYDNDGKLDLIVSNYTVWTPQSDRVCAVNGQEYYCHPKVYPNVAHRLYHNLGNGRFEDVTDSSGIGKELGKGMGVAIADFNGDGYMDVFVANDTVRNFLFINQKNGTFKESGFEWGVAYDESGNAGSSMGADAKDYDNDGRPDLFYNNLKGQIWGLFRNMDGKYMKYISGISHVSRLSEHSSGWSNAFADYNNDGWKDLYSSNGDIDNLGQISRQPDTLFENLDGKEFRDVSGQLGPDFNRAGFQRGSAFVDLNNDGFLDLVVTSLDEKPRILMNSADNGNHWLLVHAIGRRSNRDGIGATLKLTTASGRTLYNHVTTSDGFMSSSDKRAHFGLGSEKAIQSLEIRWPSGIVQTLKAPKVDQILMVTEPER